MAEQRVQRRLAAILAADVVSYSRGWPTTRDGLCFDLAKPKGGNVE